MTEKSKSKKLPSEGKARSMQTYHFTSHEAEEGGESMEPGKSSGNAMRRVKLHEMRTLEDGKEEVARTMSMSADEFLDKFEVIK